MFANDPSDLLCARATLGFLFNLGNYFTRAEKLARIYFVRWLRDGRVFLPTISDRDSGKSSPLFDQKRGLVDALLTLLAHEEFVPAMNADDQAALLRFCDWVGQWQESNRQQLTDIVAELTDRFGLPHLWQRMLPTNSTNADAPAGLSDALSIGSA